MMSAAYDVGVVGAGIVGLAHAYQLARRGLRVVVFERHRRAQGASVRNFGMIWPCGSLHLAYHEDEARVLREFVADADRPCELWSPAQVAARFPAVVPTNLHAGLWSPIELAVDPRQVIAELPAWLA